LNRLKDLICYLSGPIDFAKDNGCMWRNSLTPFLENKNVKVINPLKHIFYGTQDLDTVKRPKMAKLLEEGRYEELHREMKELTHWDLRSVDLSSFLIVNYDIDTFTCGTHEEIFKANTQMKPVLFMIGEGNRTKMPKWMHGRFHPEHMFETWEELKQYIVKVDSNPNYWFTEVDKKRWLFFDGDHMLDTATDTLLDTKIEEEKKERPWITFSYQ